MRKVVYIFEDEGDQGGGYWRLVLACGHSATRRRVVTRPDNVVQAMFRPLSDKLAPKRVKCFYCGGGSAPCDPWILIEAFGGPKRP